MCEVPDDPAFQVTSIGPAFEKRTGHQLVHMFQFEERSQYEIKADSFIVVLAFLIDRPESLVQGFSSNFSSQLGGKLRFGGP